jgi:hypothetical protein
MRLYAPNRVFVNIPDTPEHMEYEQVIRQTLEEYGLVPVLAKDHFEPVVLLCNICKLIQTCQYGITVISAPTGNVLYELGLMHATGIQCAIIQDRRATQLTYVQGLRLLEYMNTKSLAQQLAFWIDAQVDEAQKHQTKVPVSSAKDSDERETLKHQISLHRKNLNRLQEQAAKHDPLRIPLDIQNAIEELEDTIKEKTARLNSLSQEKP